MISVRSVNAKAILGRIVRLVVPSAHAARGGAPSLFVAVAVVAMFSMITLVVDGGVKITTARDADAVASAAARAGGDAATGPSLAGQSGNSVALAAARRALAASGVPGSVTVRGRTLTVTATVTRPAKFMPIVFRQTSTATADIKPVDAFGRGRP